MPAAAVIPAPQAYVKAAAVKTLVDVVWLAGRHVPQKGAGRTVNGTRVGVLSHAHFVNLEEILTLKICLTAKFFLHGILEYEWRSNIRC